ncbi:hypothetical protein HBA54_27190 [Pelagibius litoralis]|uniref:Uncharacterized protein n=1 Tax=Pelagibius litoralis TaxID=374515 RepID=A0A967KBQ0_9PROT|nr:hypothetical protein [Pelagibius litoralis]NIA72283.1 hypothetical protein [Pelagibius litoralis]
MTLFIGQKIERAWWFRNEMERFLGERNATAAVQKAAKEEGASIGPVKVETLPAGDPRLSDPPPQWRDAPCLLVSARVTAIASPLVKESFVANLDRRDLDRLRQVTRVMHHQARPDEPRLSNTDADAMIDEFGPKVGERMLREAVDMRVLN